MRLDVRLLLTLCLFSSTVSAVTIINIIPNAIDTRGGITVIITGSDFVSGASVLINGIALVGVSVDNSTTITASIPVLAEGVQDLVITNPDSQTATLANAFTVTPSPEFKAGDLAPRGTPDGQLNVADLVIMYRFIKELETPTAKEFLIANVAPLSSPDSQLNAADALILQRAILGDITLPNIIDSQAPRITITSPSNNSYTNVNTATLIGMLDEAGTLTINNTAVTMDVFFAFTHNVELLEGENIITSVATDIYGNSQSQTLTINKDTKSPATVDASRLTLNESMGQVAITGALGSVEAGATVLIVANGSIITTIANSDGSFNVQLSATSGDQVQITVIDRASNNSNTLSYIVGEVLQIITPQADFIINENSVNIVGVFSGINNSGINVNGEIACTYNNNFYVNNLPLTTGVNTLTAIHTTENGSTDSSSISITQNSAVNYKLSVNHNCGIAPLDVIFELDDGGDVIQQLDIDYDNDGIIDLSTATPSVAILQHDYTTAGVYPVSAWVTTASGTQQLSLNIVVNDISVENGILQVVWNGMKNALISGNKPAAMNYLSPDARKTYGGVFDALMPNMPAIYGELSGIEKVNINNEIADYAVIRIDNGVTKLFMINFIKNQDGVWRIDSL